MKVFKNKVVWITGASSGIGEACAQLLAKHGNKLILSARREEELERVKSTCENQENIIVKTLDLADQDTFAETTKEIVDEMGRIDVLINNGGISQRSTVSDTLMEVDRRIMEINYFGNIALAKAVLPYFKKQKSGHYVVLSSLAGKFGFFLRSSYSASKHALHGFYEALRLEEWDNNVKVTICCPGFVRTNMAQNALDAKGKKYSKEDKYQNNGISAEECATRIINAAAKNKEEVLIGRKETLAVHIKRLFPSFFTGMIRKQSPTG